MRQGQKTEQTRVLVLSKSGPVSVDDEALGIRKRPARLRSRVNPNGHDVGFVHPSCTSTLSDCIKFDELSAAALLVVQS